MFIEDETHLAVVYTFRGCDVCDGVECDSTVHTLADEGAVDDIYLFKGESRSYFVAPFRRALDPELLMNLIGDET